MDFTSIWEKQKRSVLLKKYQTKPWLLVSFLRNTALIWGYSSRLFVHFSLLFSILQVMHIFWTLTLKVIKKFKAHTVREDLLLANFIFKAN